jgi:hypothetical protein
MRMVRRKADSTPGFSYDDAVGWIVKIVADLDWQIGTDIADMVGQGGNVLGALIGHAGDPVVVDEQARSVGGIVGREGGICDGAVGDAAHRGKLIAALTLNLLRGRFFARKHIGRYRCRSSDASCNNCHPSRRTEGERQGRCD